MEICLKKPTESFFGNRLCTESLTDDIIQMHSFLQESICISHNVFSLKLIMSVNFEFLLPAVTLALSAATFIFLFLRRRNKYLKYNLPPLSKHSFFEVVSSLESGRSLDLVRTCCQELGPVFQIRLAPSTSSIIIADGALARLILDGDNARGIPCADKTKMYRRFEAGMLGVPNIFTKRTHGEGWELSRKTVAPAFSNLNIRKKIPLLHNSLSKLCDMLTKYENTAYQFDLQLLMIRFIFDFNTVALFGMCFDALGDSETDGNKVLRASDANSREYFHRQFYNPLRKYFFWNKEVQKALQARKYLVIFQQRILDDYRASKNAEELKTDPSLLGQLIRRYGISYIRLDS